MGFLYGTNFFWPNQLRRGKGCVLYRRANDQIMSGRRSFTNVFPDLNNCKCENCPQPWQDMHLKIKSRPVYKIMKRFILEGNIGKRSKVVSCSVFSHVDPDLGVLILYLKSWYLNRGLDSKRTSCTLCFRCWGFHAKPVFFFIVFGGDLCFDASLIGLF